MEQRPETDIVYATDDAVAPEGRSWAIRSPRAFGGAMVLAMFGLKILAAPLVLGAGGAGTSEGIVEGGAAAIVVSFFFLPIETLLGQALPIWAISKAGGRRWWFLCLLSAGFFGLLHLPVGPGAFVVGFAGGAVILLAVVAAEVAAGGAVVHYRRTRGGVAAGRTGVPGRGER